MKKKLLAVASGGGHWIQLLRLRPAFAGLEVQYISTDPSLAHKVAPSKTYAVRDANMWDKPGLLIMAVQMMWIILCYRPDVVVTTGAAPGYFALVFGRLMGAKTIWIDSIANAEELSLAGRKAQRWAHHWLTQWPELANESSGPHYIGSVL